jgi:hypothetical protein
VRAQQKYWDYKKKEKHVERTWRKGRTRREEILIIKNR